MMKKFVLSIIIACVALSAQAQDVELVINNQTRVFFEHTKVADNATTFAYIESTYNGSSMMKLFREQKFWESPIFLHLEYQTTFDTHTAIVGASYSFYLSKGFISIAPLARYDWGMNSFALQLSNSYLFNFGRVELYGYNHAWHNGAFCFFGEERVHLNISGHYSVGMIINISHFEKWKITPSLGLRYRF